MSNETVTEQNVFLFNRSRLELEGISDVESFTDNSVTALSSLGSIAIDGSELKVELFSNDSGKLIINGKIDSIYYFGRERSKRKLFSSRKG